MTPEQLLREGLAVYGLPADAAAIEGLEEFSRRLLERNQVMNLTAITGEEESARLHFLDCAALLTAEDLSGKTVIDVGTGAGFPGIPLKIACPTLRLTLLDSLAKRVHFLEQVVDRLGLTDTELVLSRAEEAPGRLREQFDAATARAVTRLDALAELCLPLVRQGGVFLAMKGPDPQTEIREAEKAIRVLGGTVERVVPYTIPGTDVTHTVVVIRKTGITPKQYPRRWAKIQKEPIR